MNIGKKYTMFTSRQFVRTFHIFRIPTSPVFRRSWIIWNDITGYSTENISDGRQPMTRVCKYRKWRWQSQPLAAITHTHTHTHTHTNKQDALRNLRLCNMRPQIRRIYDWLAILLFTEARV